MGDNMKKRLSGLIAVVFMMFTSAMNASGEEAKPEVRPVTSLEDIKNLLGMSIYLQGGYTFNFQTPDSMTNEQRLFDSKANTFLVDLAQLQFAKNPAVGGLGYKLKLSYGETAKFIHSAGLGNPNDEFDLTEAYIDYVAPLGGGVKLKFGKFATYHGAEVIEAKNNYNYSRSFLFNFAEPLTHTGVMAGYRFSEIFTASLYLVNGWDVTDDNNNAKTVGAGFAFTPIAPLQLTFNFMYGPEQTNNTSNNRFFFNWVGAFEATKKLTLVANVDYGHEVRDPKNNGQDSEWYGVAGYAKYEFTDFFSAAIRAEYFNDEDGVRTGIAQELKEVTLTADFKVAKLLLVRPEYRHDWSTNNAFDSKKTFDMKNQDTLAVGLMYTW